MNYQDTLNFFYDRTNYEKRQPVQYTEDNFNLHYAKNLFKKFGSPQKSPNIIHVAGTNGKGSTCFYLEQILLSSGHTTGTFLSPHIFRINERIRINGTEISDQQLIDTAETIKAKLPKEETPTTFELLFLAAMIIFNKENCEYMIIETGLGGRLDSTNIVTPALCIITPIALDHQAILGNTLSAIAKEKAGIIKPDTPIISAKQKRAAAQIIKKTAKQQNAPFSYPLKIKATATSLAGTAVLIAGFQFHLPMAGTHQTKNFALAFHAAQLLNIPINVPKLHARLSNNHLPGRIEFFPGQPAFLIDGAHNPAALKNLADNAGQWDGPITIIIAMMQDKSIAKNITIIKKIAKKVLLTTLPNPRAASVTQLSSHFKKEKDQFVSPQEALEKACKEAAQNELIIITGSFYLAGELRNNIITRASATQRNI